MQRAVCDEVLLFIREVAIRSSITIYLILTNEVSYYYKILQHNIHITKHPIKYELQFLYLNFNSQVNSMRYCSCVNKAPPGDKHGS